LDIFISGTLLIINGVSMSEETQSIESEESQSIKSEEGHSIKKEVNRYFLVFAALLVLSTLTVGISYIQFGVALAVTVALVIATVKGSLVASYFMHLSHERKLIYGILLMTVSFLACMMILFIASFYDPLFGTENLNKKNVPRAVDKHDTHQDGEQESDHVS